ncbi:unnamed protein product [Prunus armeniaca]
MPKTITFKHNMPCQAGNHYFRRSHATRLSGPKPRKCPRLAEWVGLLGSPETQAHFLSPNMWVSIKERKKEPNTLEN